MNGSQLLWTKCLGNCYNFIFFLNRKFRKIDCNSPFQRKSTCQLPRWRPDRYWSMVLRLWKQENKAIAKWRTSLLDMLCTCQTPPLPFYPARRKDRGMYGIDETLFQVQFSSFRMPITPFRVKETKKGERDHWRRKNCGWQFLGRLLPKPFGRAGRILSTQHLHVLSVIFLKLLFITQLEAK